MQIRISANPFFIDRDNWYLNSFSEPLGRNETILNVIQDIADYIQEFESCETVWVLAIKGEMGSGKSLFARKLILEVGEQEKTIFRSVNLQYPKLHFEYLVCNNDCEKNCQFIGVWRPFLRHLLEIYSLHEGQSKENIINAQLAEDTEFLDKVQTIEEIFGLKNILPKRRPGAQSVRTLNIFNERYDESYEETVLLFCFEFIAHAIKTLREIVCYLIVFDNVETMNYNSWKLFRMVQSECAYLVILMNIQSDETYFENPQFKVSNLGFKIDSDEQTQRFYMDYIKRKEDEIFSLAEMTPISKESLKTALLSLSNVYERTMNREIDAITDVVNGSSRKTHEIIRNDKTKLIALYQVHVHFDKIENDVLDTILQQSRGNPLCAFYFTYQALLQGYLGVTDHVLQFGEKYKDYLHFRSWSNLRLPFLMMKQMSVVLESALKMSNKRTPRLSGLMTVQIMQLLLSASVIGDVFSQQMLDKVNKQVVEKSKQIGSTEILKEAENRDLIELIMPDEVTGDSFYRFTDPNMRTALYQMQSFLTSKMETHEKIIQVMKKKSVQDYTNGWSYEEEYTGLLRHAMRFDRTYEEHKLSQKSKQVLQIKKINQQLQKHNKKLKEGEVMIWDKDQYKKVTGLLTSNRLEFYSKDDSFKKFGEVELKEIREIKFKDPQDTTTTQTAEQRTVNEETSSIEIYTSKWKKMTQISEEERSDLIKLAPVEKKQRSEIEDWMTAVDFVRTKVTFEKFVNDYGSVKFPINSSIDDRGDNLASRNDRLAKQLRGYRPRNGSRSSIKSISLSQSAAERENEIKNFNKQTKAKLGNESFLLAQRLKALYKISCLQFFDHISDPSKELGEVNQPLYLKFIETCKFAVQDDAQDSTIQEFEVEQNSQQSQILRSLDDGLNEPPRIISQFDQEMEHEQHDQPVQWEELKVSRLNYINSLWREGEVTQQIVQSQFDVIQDFKLQRKQDTHGYNKILSPYKTITSAAPSSPTKQASIKELQSDFKSPSKYRKPKAEAIYKILENANSPFYLNYLNQVKNRPQKQEQLQQSAEKSKNLQIDQSSLNHSLSKMSSQSSSTKQSHVVHGGGLIQSMSHVSIGKSQIDQETEQNNLTNHSLENNTITKLAQNTQNRRATLRSSITSRRGNHLIESAMQSKAGDLEQIHDQLEQQSSQGSFRDYQSYLGQTPTPDKHPDQLVSFHKGCPVTLITEKPQFIGPRDFKAILKKGDVVYLSEQLTDAPYVKCHTWFDGKKIELLIGRYEVQLMQDSTTMIDAKKIKNLNQNDFAMQVKNRQSEVNILDQTEELLQKSFGHIGQFLEQSKSLSPNESAMYIRRVNSQNKDIDATSTLFRKLQERKDEKKRKEMLLQRPHLSELLNSTPVKMTIPEMSPAEEVSPLNQQSPNSALSYSTAIPRFSKVAERMKKKQQLIQLV